MTTLVDICNRALAEIAAGPIADPGENSIEAREAGRFSAALMAELSHWTDWSWAIRRATLAGASNDRPAEWLYAYAVPDDCARPLAVRAVEAAATVLPLGGPYPFPAQDALPLAFLHESGLIYTNVAGATLVYLGVLSDPATLPPLVLRAFELELAARIALPIRKDAGLAHTLATAAEIARARAIAEDINQRAASPARFISEAAFARAGLGAML